MYVEDARSTALVLTASAAKVIQLVRPVLGVILDHLKIRVRRGQAFYGVGADCERSQHPPTRPALPRRYPQVLQRLNTCTIARPTVREVARSVAGGDGACTVNFPKMSSYDRKEAPSVERERTPPPDVAYVLSQLLHQTQLTVW